MTSKERRKTIREYLSSKGYGKNKIGRYFKRKPNVFFKSEVEEDIVRKLI